MRKVTTVVLAVLLCAGISILALMANVGDKAFAVETYTDGNVEISLISSGEGGSALVPGGEAEKTYKIQNAGENDAWVWLTYAVPAALNDDNVAMAISASLGDNWVAKETAEETIDGEKYNVYTLMCNTALAKSQTTSDVKLSASIVTNIDRDENGNWIRVINGEVTELEWNSDSVEVHISAYGALKTDTVDTVEKAYAAYNVQNSSSENTSE